MEAYQERVVTERDELEEKIEKLVAFMFHSGHFQGIPEREQDLLNRQLEAMREYSSILEERIEGFE
jgi:hypothetical protein